MAALLGAGIGAALGLIYTAAKDLLESDGPDPQKIQQIKDAIAAREQELIQGGTDAMEASMTASEEFKQALAEASTDTDGTTMGDYLGNMATGAGIGAGAAMIPAVGRGLGAGVGKLKSFLGAGAKEAPRAESLVGGLRTTDPARTAAQQAASRDIKEPAVKDAMERLSAERAASMPQPIAEPLAEVAKAAPRRGRVQIVGSDVARAMEGKASEAADEGAGMMFKRLGPAGRPFAGGGGPQSFLGFGDDAKEVAQIDDIIDAALAKHMPVKDLTRLSAR